MAIPNIAISAYRNAIELGERTTQSGNGLLSPGKSAENRKSFASTIEDSLKNVNELQSQKRDMIESFAAGESENVHELMITLQKAGLAVNMTSAVRNKVMEAYKELMRIQF